MSFVETLFGLHGRVAVVTGGAGVLGGYMCQALASAGAKVAILNRSEEKALPLVAAIKETGGEAMALPADVLNRAQLEEAAARLEAEWGTADILVNAAGGNMPGATVPPDKTIFDLVYDEVEKVVDLNFHGTLLPTLVFARGMSQKGQGSIVNISSMAAERAITRVAGYSAAKGAVNNLTRWLAVELCHKYGEGVRVNAIAPGFFLADQNRALLTNPDGSYTDRGKTIIRQTPMGRFGQAEELAGALLWLASDASKFVTGTVVAIDGGFAAFSGV